MAAALSTLTTLTTLVLLSVLSLSAVARRPPRTHPWFGAVCISQSSRCNNFYSRWSDHRCHASTRWDRQPRRCYTYVCRWCNQYAHRRSKAPCNHRHVRRVCASLRGPPKPPAPAPSTPTPSSRPRHRPGPRPGKGQCVWTARRGVSDRVVIDMGRVPLARGWDRVTRGSRRGIIFRRSPSKHISPPGKYGKFCVHVNPPHSGKYYLTAISYAPHNTEHNDVWVESQTGFELWQRGRQHSYVPPGRYTKAYQNNGRKGLSDDFKTIDFNGHRFLVPNLVKGRLFRLCLAGRSKKYSIFQLLLIKCHGEYCTGGIMKNLFNEKASRRVCRRH